MIEIPRVLDKYMLDGPVTGWVASHMIYYILLMGFIGALGWYFLGWSYFAIGFGLAFGYFTESWFGAGMIFLAPYSVRATELIAQELAPEQECKIIRAKPSYDQKMLVHELRKMHPEAVQTLTRQIKEIKEEAAATQAAKEEEVQMSAETRNEVGLAFSDAFSSYFAIYADEKQSDEMRRGALSFMKRTVDAMCDALPHVVYQAWQPTNSTGEEFHLTFESGEMTDVTMECTASINAVNIETGELGVFRLIKFWDGDKILSGADLWDKIVAESTDTTRIKLELPLRFQEPGNEPDIEMHPHFFTLDTKSQPL